MKGSNSRMTTQLEIPPVKQVHVETWGCQMNVADSEKMVSMLKEHNYVLTNDPQNADLIILNTCHIREKARHKVVSRLGVLKELKKTNPQLTIAVTGCVAQAEGKKLLEAAPSIDVLIGPGKLNELPRLLKEHAICQSQTMAIGFEKPNYEEKLDGMACQSSSVSSDVLEGKNHVSRFVTIQQGCNNFCTFCVVPFTRGREISERPEVIKAKVKALIKLGAKEITLLGQNVNSYGSDLIDNGVIAPSLQGAFVDLLQEVAEIDGLERLRITTSNPHDLTKPLADIFARQPKLGKYFHLPVQSGSDRVLKAMKRKVTHAEYLERVDWLRAAVPDMAISTDLIVGFPSETEEDFVETLELIKKVRFSFVFAFMYSPRKGTAAIRFKDQVPEHVKADRLARLNQLQDSITQELHAKQIGQDREVLFLYESQKEPSVYYGRDEYFHLVRVQASRNLIGHRLGVKILSANKTALAGQLL